LQAGGFPHAHTEVGNGDFAVADVLVVNQNFKHRVFHADPPVRRFHAGLVHLAAGGRDVPEFGFLHAQWQFLPGVIVVDGWIGLGGEQGGGAGKQGE